VVAEVSTVAVVAEPTAEVEAVIAKPLNSRNGSR
jgi:hypothetical protein